jgi:hypothetical protein
VSSSAVDVHVALAAAIDASDEARAAVGRTGVGPIAFSAVAPATTPLGYYTIGDTGEGERNVMAAPGSTVDVTLHAWGPNAIVALKGWAALESLLNRRPLQLDAGAMLLGTTRLITTLADPDGKATQAVVRYTAVCRGA